MLKVLEGFLGMHLNRIKPLIWVVLFAVCIPINSVAFAATKDKDKQSKTKVVIKSTKKPKSVRVAVTRSAEPAAPARPSLASALGMRGQHDDLSLKSSVAMVVNQDTKEVYFEKNSSVSLPIASITKLMTAMVVLDSKLPLDESLVINSDDVNIYRNSRLAGGTVLTREEALLLALMSSENRAAYTLGRNYPGGINAFIDAMNRKAKELGTKYGKKGGTALEGMGKRVGEFFEHGYPSRVLDRLTEAPAARAEAGAIRKGVGRVNGAVGIQPSSNTSYTAVIFGTSGGSQIGSITCTTTATAYNTSSDYRLKDNQAALTGSGAFIDALKPKTWTWKADGSTGVGFIAHEVQEQIPSAVFGEKDAVDAEGKPVYQGVDTSFLVATLTAAIKELKSIVDAQATEITTLQTQVKALTPTGTPSA